MAKNRAAADSCPFIILKNIREVKTVPRKKAKKGAGFPPLLFVQFHKPRLQRENSPPDCFPGRAGSFAFWQEAGAACLPPGGPLPARGSPAARPVPQGPARAVPSCASSTRRRFGLCGGRVGALPQRPATFEKVDETFFSATRRFLKAATREQPLSLARSARALFRQHPARSVPAAGAACRELVLSLARSAPKVLEGVVLSSTPFSRTGHPVHVCFTTRTFRGRNKNRFPAR